MVLKALIRWAEPRDRFEIVLYVMIGVLLLVPTADAQPPGHNGHVYHGSVYGGSYYGPGTTYGSGYNPYATRNVLVPIVYEVELAPSYYWVGKSTQEMKYQQDLNLASAIRALAEQNKASNEQTSLLLKEFIDWKRGQGGSTNPPTTPQVLPQNNPRIPQASNGNSPQTPSAAPRPAGRAGYKTVISRSCVQCHNGPGGKGGVDLSNPDTVPRKVRVECLSQVLQGLMPKGDKISLDDLEDLKEWVASGP